MRRRLLAALQLGMTQAVHSAFWVMVVAAVAGLVAVLWFPKALREVVETPRRVEVAAAD